MKRKLLSFLFIIPLLFASMFMLSACGKENLKSITLSLSGQDVLQNSKNTWTVAKRNKPYQVQAVLFPAEYSVDDLTWRCTPSDVATITTSGALSAKSGGLAEVSAQYKNSDGSVVFASIKVYVSETKLPTYSQMDINVTYEGANLLESESALSFVPNNMTDSFELKYYEIVENNGKKNYVETAELLNVGDYIVQCVQKASQQEICSLNIHITPAVIPAQVQAPVISSVYGDESFDGVFATGQDIDYQTGTVLYGIGNDSSREIGKYVFVSHAQLASGVGNYVVDARMQFASSQDEKNYKFEYTKGSHTISPRQVVVKVLDKDIIYGDNIGDVDYALYDYAQYANNGNSFDDLAEITSEIVSYKANISTGNAILKKDNKQVEKNSFNQYPVLWQDDIVAQYDLSSKFVCSGNVQMETVVGGKIKISPRDIEVTPQSRQKIFGEKDENEFFLGSYSYGVVDEKEILPFIFVSYNTTASLGEKNMLAPVGTYYYAVDNTKNKNYNFSLCEDAKMSISRIVYEVLPAEVVIKFADVLDEYYKATDVVGVSEGYQLKMVESLTVAGKVVVQNKQCNEVFEEGKLALIGEDKMGLSLRLDEVTNSDKNIYKKFKISLREFFFDSPSSKKENYRVTVLDSYLTTKREKLTVTPYIKPYYSDGFDASRVYDGTVVSTIDGLYSSYIIEGNFINGETSSDILPQNTNFLTMQKDGKYVKVLSSGEVFVDEMKDCGRYKIMLDESVVVNAGMEHYELCFDTSKTYCYEIKQKQVHIVLDTSEKIEIDGQQYPVVYKTYGQGDPNFSFKTVDVVVEPVSSGKLARHKIGKDTEVVGRYPLTLGDASLGENYSLVLDNCYLQILPRKVTVVPTSPVVTYGSDISLNQYSYNIDNTLTFDESLTTAPTFAGSFALQKHDTNVVKNTCYKVGVYNIVAGNFACTSDNYIMTLSSDATYTVTAKKTVLDILSISNADKNTTPISDVILANSQLKLRQSVGNVTLSATAELTDGGDNYYLASKDDINLQISLGSEDVSDCYEWTLGQKIVYYFGKTLIELRVVKKGDTTSSASVIYNGSAVGDLFELVCTNENFSIDSSSAFQLVYTDERGNELTENPTNVGSYSVVPKVDTNHKLVISYIQDGETKTVEFSGLTQSSSSTLYVVSLQEVGYLTITKADIEIATEYVQFENDLTYGANSMPNLKTEYIENGETKKVFTFKEGEEVILTTFDGKNYRIIDGSEDISTLDVGTYNYTLIVQPENANYNTATIHATLNIVPKQVKLTGGTAQLPEELIYNGTTKNCIITPTFDIEDVPYNIAYRYIKLKAESVDGVDIMLNAYDYSGGSINKENPTLISPDSIASSTSEITYELKTIDGINYVVINGAKAVEVGLANSSPLGAGAYICVANISSRVGNYVITRNDSPCSVAYLYEIKKNGDLSISFNKTEFFYGTEFDLVSSNATIPFECSVTPNIGNSLHYVAVDDWGTDTILAVGTYRVKVKAITDNFYKEETFEFAVLPCIAEIEFPPINSYAFTGSRVTSFFENIKAKKYDKDGNLVDTQIFSLTNKDFTARFFQYDEETGDYTIDLLVNQHEDIDGTSNIPVYVGKYLLKLTYGSESSNYYGTGDYYYSIQKPAYSGEITVVTREITYNPNISATGLYNLIRYGDESALTTNKGMFKIDLTESQYDLKIYVKVLDEDVELVKDSSDWIKYVMTCENGGVDLKFVVTFKGDKEDFAPAEITRKLSVQRREINREYFSEPSGITGYYYSGFEVYHALKYRGFAPLDKLQFDTNEVFYNGSEEVTVEYYDNSKTDYHYAVKMLDKLGNEIGLVGFVYYEDGLRMDRIPIVPGENYKVRYYVSINGSNYSSSDDLKPESESPWESSFRINKIDLSVKIEVEPREYSNKSFTLKDINIITSSSNVAELNVRTVVSQDGNEANFLSNPPSDIVLVVRLLSGVSELTLPTSGSGPTLILSKGVYTIKVSLLHHSSYDITKFFSSVVLYDGSSSKTYSSSEIAESGGDSRGVYGITAIQDLTISPVKFNANTIEDLIKSNTKGTNNPIAVVKNNGKEYYYKNERFFLDDNDDSTVDMEVFDLFSGDIVALDKNCTIELTDDYKDFYTIQYYQANSDWAIVNETPFVSIQALIKALEGTASDGISKVHCIVKFVATKDASGNSNYEDSVNLKFWRKKLCPWETGTLNLGESGFELSKENGTLVDKMKEALTDSPQLIGDSANISSGEEGVYQTYIVKQVQFSNKTGDRTFTSNFYRKNKDGKEEKVDAFMMLFSCTEETIIDNDGNECTYQKVVYCGYADDENGEDGQFSKNIRVTGGVEVAVKYFIVIGVPDVDIVNYTYFYDLSITTPASTEA
ncbi:MAG: hypothetical protein ACI4L7_03685 [Christensenellales bacterium]